MACCTTTSSSSSPVAPFIPHHSINCVCLMVRLPDGRLENSPIVTLPAQSRLGTRVMSIQLLLTKRDEAVIWRGPLVGRAIRQLWGDIL